MHPVSQIESHTDPFLFNSSQPLISYGVASKSELSEQQIDHVVFISQLSVGPVK